MSFLSGGQLLIDKLILQSVQTFVGSYPVLNGIGLFPAQTGNAIGINSSHNRKWNYENVHKLET